MEAQVRDLAAHLDPHRERLFTFLNVTGLDATNYRAEQAIRPAAANRKLCARNRTRRGAAAQSVLLTVLRTCRQQTRDSIVFVAGRLCGRAQPSRLGCRRRTYGARGGGVEWVDLPGGWAAARVGCGRARLSAGVEGLGSCGSWPVSSRGGSCFRRRGGRGRGR